MIAYHDTEWGKPVHDDKKIFEFLVLESFQAGLSWEIVLNKRENFRTAFSGFDPKRVATFGEAKVALLMQDTGIIRNRAKILAAINNASRFLAVQEEFGTFDRYIWGFVDYKTIQNAPETLSNIPAKTHLSDKIGADLKKRGFKFLGSTVIYAHMQATGMVNDHTIDCFRHKELRKQ